MTKTLLIVFVHGFRGGNDTFGSFPTHLRALVSHRLPDIHVVARVYPQYETRGELAECVSRFRDWLQNEVIDLEVASGAPSPTIDPSVHVMIVGHSMGGIVAAETILAIAAEQPIPPTGTSTSKSSASMENSIGKVPDALGEPTAFMFPHIQGLLAFDTPFLGICPGVVSYTAESHYKKASAAVNTITDVVGALGLNKNNNTNPNSNNNSERDRAPRRSNTMPSSSSSSSSNPASTRRGAEPVTTGDAATVPAWHKLGKYAMFAGAAGALAAGGAAAAWYAKREQFREGWSWATGHLEFVSCLRRPEALKGRLEEFG
ncbi:hypothetical protein KEM55_004064 [Ascosphaera atra]|nr:hypothetical protein KEM55_004064 [Ascosphaera atra]